MIATILWAPRNGVILFMASSVRLTGYGVRSGFRDARFWKARHILWFVICSFSFLACPRALGQDAEDREPNGAATTDERVPAVDLAVTYTSDFWRNTRGGVRTGNRYLDNLDVQLTVDGERSVGLEGATFFLYALYNNGRSLSGDLIGDAQVVSNIETGVRALRLYEAWVEQRFGAERSASLKVGLYDLNSEFDTSQAAGLFINSSHGIGPDFSQSGQNGPSIFPVTSLAARLDWRLSDNIITRLAVLDAVPGNPDRPARTAIQLGNGEGALLVGEVNYLDSRTKVGIGYWHYTGEFEALFASALAGEPVTASGNDGAYALLEHKLTNPDAAGPHFVAWARFGLASQRFNAISHYLGAGLVISAPLAGRDQDQVGIAFGLTDFSTPFRRASALIGQPTDGHELTVELTYRAPLFGWLTIQPNVQYITNPGGNNALRDALAIGLRLEFGL